MKIWKRNKKRICPMCGQILFNRMSHAVYCKECVRKRRTEYQRNYMREYNSKNATPTKLK